MAARLARARIGAQRLIFSRRPARLTRQTNATAFLGLAQSLGQFAARHLLILLFTILLLFFLYEQGESLARDFKRWLRRGIGEQAERHIDVVTRAVRASVNSMFAVGLFDGFATGLAYAVVGVPRAAVWGAIIGAIAAVPFLGYGVVAALALRIAIEGQATLALLALALGWAVLLGGDKVIRPLVARGGVRLPFVGILMACLGGFEVLGLVGLVVGPVVLALAKELWSQRLRGLDRSQAGGAPYPHSVKRELVMHDTPSNLQDIRSELTCDAWSERPRLTVRRTEIPRPGPGQVLVRVDATSVNPIDVKRAAGYGRRLLGLKGAATLPVVLGNDIAGVVQEVGPGAAHFSRNLAVFGLVGTGRAPGAHASHVLVPQEQLVAAPESIPSTSLAVLPYSFTTMWLALASTSLRPSNATGTSVLINGADGGLGRLALNLLRAWGSRVTAICAQGTRQDCLALGAELALERGPGCIESLPADYRVVLNFGSWDDDPCWPRVSRLTRRDMRPPSIPCWPTSIVSVGCRGRWPAAATGRECDRSSPSARHGRAMRGLCSSRIAGTRCTG
jgi:hypothetical protein